MERTLEQVIMDASQELFGDGFGSGAVRRSEAAAIAEAVRGWMNEVAREPGHGPSGGVQGVQATRIKELEAGLAEEQSTRNLLSDENRALRVRLEEVTAFLRLDTSGEESWNALADKAAKYDELRVKFPYMPGEVFYVMAANNGKLYKDTVSRLCVDGKIDGEKIVNVRPEAAHPTVDACRAAIPVEE